MSFNGYERFRKIFKSESLSLKELTEWLFDDYSSQNAWCTNLLAEDGLYFFWNKDIIILRQTEQIKVYRKTKAREELRD